MLSFDFVIYFWHTIYELRGTFYKKILRWFISTCGRRDNLPISFGIETKINNINYQERVLYLKYSLPIFSSKYSTLSNTQILTFSTHTFFTSCFLRLIWLLFLFSTWQITAQCSWCNFDADLWRCPGTYHVYLFIYLHHVLWASRSQGPRIGHFWIPGIWNSYCTQSIYLTQILVNEVFCK